MVQILNVLLKRFTQNRTTKAANLVVVGDEIVKNLGFLLLINGYRYPISLIALRLDATGCVVLAKALDSCYEIGVDFIGGFSALVRVVRR